MSYQYDLAGRRTRITWPDTFYVVYDYDLGDAVTAIRENGATSGAGVLATYAYDDLGHRTSLTRGNGVTTTYTIDAASRLTDLTLNLSGTTSDQTWTYSYDAAMGVRTRAGSNSAYAVSPAPANVTRSYTSNGLNQLTTSGSLTLTYDSKGNLASDGVNSYSYDAANRFTGISGITLSYDPAGRLYETAGGSTTRFAYDGVDMVGEYNTSGVLQRRYVHGPAVDEPLIWYEGSGTGDRRWLLADRLGSVVGVTDASGTASTINLFDEYGQPGASNAGRFQYTGQIWLPEVGLYHYKARTYSPTIGRFLQPDPIGYGDGLNLYSYVGNDPINARDPSGKETAYVKMCVPKTTIRPSTVPGEAGTLEFDWECNDYPISIPGYDDLVTHHDSLAELAVYLFGELEESKLCRRIATMPAGQGLYATAFMSWVIVGGAVISTNKSVTSNGNGTGTIREWKSIDSRNGLSLGASGIVGVIWAPSDVNTSGGRLRAGLRLAVAAEASAGSLGIGLGAGLPIGATFGGKNEATKETRRTVCG